jgi:hypothetical protein
MAGAFYLPRASDFGDAIAKSLASARQRRFHLKAARALGIAFQT